MFILFPLQPWNISILQNLLEFIKKEKYFFYVCRPLDPIITMYLGVFEVNRSNFDLSHVLSHGMATCSLIPAVWDDRDVTVKVCFECVDNGDAGGEQWAILKSLVNYLNKSKYEIWLCVCAIYYCELMWTQILRCCLICLICQSLVGVEFLRCYGPI